MNETLTLYLITKTSFELLEDAPQKAKVAGMAHSKVLFEHIYEGLDFLLLQFFTGEDKHLINEIYVPTEFIGESFDEIPVESYTEDDVDEFEANAIYYLDPEKVARIDYLLSELDQAEVLNTYSSKGFNNNGVYPEVWHDDESENQFFNKTHLKQALESLTAFFEKAIENENYVVIFLGE